MVLTRIRSGDYDSCGRNACRFLVLIKSNVRNGDIDRYTWMGNVMCYRVWCCIRVDRVDNREDTIVFGWLW